ncbi:MAG: ATP phosphoribosyltransferase regulatory subunit [Pseudomonadota bacterium]|nr:ATP phosphoribosyltransferase regulatory subunit [Pseudomonadota bacterium]
MTIEDRWLLPEGIEEALPDRAQRLEYYRRALLDLYARWGYELVIPPMIEYLESLLVGSSFDLDLLTFKLTDQLTGRMMGVRPDMTPQVARIDAHMLKRDGPVRLCYIGTVLRTRAETAGRSRGPLQLGAELYGHAGLDSDLEIMRLMIETLRLMRIPAVHLDLGHVGIYWNLVRQAGLNREQEFALFDMLQRKAVPEVADYLRGLNLAGESRDMLAALTELNGGREVLTRARQQLHGADARVSEALDYLDAAAERLEQFSPEVELHFDLAELRGYQYHTGTVFAAFTEGQGQEIARGGRYDEIGKVFGRARPATGFSADLHTLIGLGTDTPPAVRPGVYAPASSDPALVAKVTQLRAAGERVICGLTDQQGGAKTMGCTRQLVQQDGQWIEVSLN